LHVHTEYSPCSKMSITSLLETAQRRGLDAVAITDHNTIKGALEAKKVNPFEDLRIIIGCEKKCEYGELLIYNLKHEIKSNKFQEIIKEAREQGALVFIAHPIDYLRLNNSWKRLGNDFLHSVDGVEVYNGRNVFNNKTRVLYYKRGLHGVAGSDAHYREEVGNTYVVYNNDLWEEVMNRKARFIHHNSLFNKVKYLFKSFRNKWL
jgi:predicted metal-dependent phosphoesterase TrpH